MISLQDINYVPYYDTFTCSFKSPLSDAPRELHHDEQRGEATTGFALAGPGVHPTGPPPPPRDPTTRRG